MTDRREARTGPGAVVEHGVIVGSDVVVGPNAVVLAAEAGSPSPTRLGDGVAIGANATILGGVDVGIGARIGPGSVVARSVPAGAIVEGNPARIVGFRDAGPARSGTGGPMTAAPDPGVRTSRVAGVTLHTLRLVEDLRGNLTAGAFGSDVPFVPQRWFLVFDVPGAEARGAHAHLACHQFLVAVRGSIGVAVDDGSAREEYLLDRPNAGLYLPPMTWATQYGHSTDAVLLVFASHPYDPDDYIRDYARFIALVGSTPGAGHPRG